MNNYKIFILAGIFLMLSVVIFFFINYPDMIKEFPQYDPVTHQYVPKSEITRQEEMRYSERFPDNVYIFFIRPLFLDFACFSVVFYMLWVNIDIPFMKDLKHFIKYRPKVKEWMK